MKEITFEQASQLENIVFIDVRSPGEFEDSHVPGAMNIPLFSNEDRAQVGTTYKQVGQKPAQWLGMEIVSPKIPVMMEQLKEQIHQGKLPVIYCWRGGMRSKSVCTFAEMAGMDVRRLTGGFRAYRQWVLEQLENPVLPERFVVLHGMTGVGKTTILYRLLEKGFPIMDLEKFAGHRGSVFGGIGYKVNNQKTFESMLVQALQKVSGLPYVFIEAESKRIGKSVQPEFMMKAKKRGLHILLTASVETRVERIYEEYVTPYSNDPTFKETIVGAIQPILKRMSPALRKELKESVEMDDYRTFIRLLLTDYYDSRYEHKQLDYEGPFKEINVDNMDQAVQEIIAYADAHHSMDIEDRKKAQPQG